jgi:hypothetical protein
MAFWTTHNLHIVWVFHAYPFDRPPQKRDDAIFLQSPNLRIIAPFQDSSSFALLQRVPFKNEITIKRLLYRDKFRVIIFIIVLL